MSSETDLQSVLGRIRSQVAVDDPYAKETGKMKCSIAGCPGQYEVRLIVHTVRHRGQVVVIDHVPAEVCSVCGDVLLTPETVRHIDALLQAATEPARTAPVYEYA